MAVQTENQIFYKPGQLRKFIGASSKFASCYFLWKDMILYSFKVFSVYLSSKISASNQDNLDKHLTGKAHLKKLRQLEYEQEYC